MTEELETSTLSWDELLLSLRKAFATDSVDVDHVNHVMSLYVSDKNDWKQYSNFDPHKYVEGEISVLKVSLQYEGSREERGKDLRPNSFL